MVIGLGTDLVDIRRIERLHDRFGARFVQRLFASTEIQRVLSRAAVQPRQQACAYAKLFAAKEACAKALGTGFSQGIRALDLIVLHQPSGQPAMHLIGPAWQRLLTLSPSHTVPVIHLSLTDEYPFAHAILTISVCP